MWTFKMNSRNTKTTNEPTATNNKSDRPQGNILDTWKTLKYLNINDSFHLKDLEISKYKRESKGRWPIKMCRFIFVNCYLFLNIKSVKIYAIPIIFTTTLLLYKLDTLLLKQKNLPVLMRKKKPVISNTGHFFCFNSTVSYAYTLVGGHLHLEFLGFSLSSI
jgi:hypothetical protein